MNSIWNKKVIILVVDDNLQNLNLIGNILEKTGYEVAMAMNGKEALEFIDEERTDLVLLDVMMPEMDGYQVCVEMKKVKKNEGIPVIFLTAKSDSQSIVKGFESGGVDYISKPFNTEELLARVNTHIELKRAREEILDLQGLIPICSNCKQIRDDDGFWQRFETYFQDRTDVRFSHSVCPNCKDILYPELKKLREQKKQST